MSVKRPAITIGMTVQPEVLQSMGDQAGFRTRGLTARFLYSLPVSTLGSRALDGAGVPPEVADDYDREIRKLLTVEPPERAAILSFSASALAEWRVFQRMLEPRRGPRGDLGTLADWASKCDGAVVRLAGLLHAAEHPHDPCGDPISAATVARACAIGHYLIDHARAAHGQLGLDPIADKGRRLVDWVRSKGLREMERRDALRSGVGGCGVRRDLDPVLELLCDRGILTPIGAVDPRTGKGPSLFAVSPAVYGEPIDPPADP
mgnify:FL=1